MAYLKAAGAVVAMCLILAGLIFGVLLSGLPVGSCWVNLCGPLQPPAVRVV